MRRSAGAFADQAWMLYLALGAVASGLYLIGPGLQGSGPLLNVISASSAVAILIGIRVHRPAAVWPWRAFAIAQLLFVLGDVYTHTYPVLIGHDVRFPSLGDGLYVLVYPALMAGILIAVRQRNPHGDRGGVIDAIIITVGIAVLSWLFLMAPYVHDATLSPLATAVSIAYPLGDVLVLAAALRLALDGGRRRGSFFLITAAILTVLVTDTAYGYALLNGTYDHQLGYDAGWLLYYLLWGAAALHPSMRTFAEATPDRERRLSRQRLALLTAASLVAPAIVFARETGRGDFDLLLIVSASIVVFLLVIARVLGLVRQDERTVARERALRSANLALVEAKTPEEIGAVALRTAELLLDGAAGVTVVLLDPATPTPELAPGFHAGEFPLAVRGDRRGLLVATAPTPFSAIVIEALGALSASVSLALESAALADEMHRREGEERFASLVRNASDLITVVDRDGSVLYQSPSIERILGLTPADVIGTRFESLLVPGDRARLRTLLQPAGAGASCSQAFDCSLVDRDGRTLRFEVVATDLCDDEAVRGIVLNGRDASERAAFEEQLAHQAFHDAVTGLPNRALFTNRVEHALAIAEREGTSVAVLILDLDDFKTINDGLGHAAGDAVLQQVGAQVLHAVRVNDTTARFSGDEFAILLEDVSDPVQAIDLAERLVQRFAAPIAVLGNDVVVRMSIGIALSVADSQQITSGAGELIRDADAAMYICKREEKGSYRVFEAAMHERVLERLELRAELRRAIDEEQFELYFQPVLRLFDGAVEGVEALVRWHHPSRGFVQPGHFIPLAEEMGLIVDLGRWVLRESCRIAMQLRTAGEVGPKFGLGVNLSVKQLQHPDVIADVRAALEESGIAPRQLVLEITETVLMADLELSSRRLHELKDLGVQIAMDDFGTGYSSLGYLSRFPVDVLKMDRSFLASRASPQASGMAAAIIALGKTLGLQVVAEGIEEAEQYEALRALGCDFGQGFFMAPPMDLAATRAWLAEADRTSRPGQGAAAA